MRPEPRGEPVHTRALEVTIAREAGGDLAVHGSLIDLRTRGFLPLGGSMQGMGVIHHMELDWRVDPEALTVREFEPAQPTVAFEASPETEGESCRQPMDRVRALAGVTLGDGFSRTLRESIGGANGCSHILTLSLCLDAAVRSTLAYDRGTHPARWTMRDASMIARRDLVFAGHEVEDGRVEMAVRLADLNWNTEPPTALAPERFARHRELAAVVEIDLWPGEIRTVRGAERTRTLDAFADAAWVDRTDGLAALEGAGLARGAAGEILRRLGDDDLAPWRDAFLQLAPAVVQCRAAHPDAWHEKVRRTEKHPGLTAVGDSCWMWRKGGALERVRARHGAGKGGR